MNESYPSHRALQQNLMKRRPLHRVALMHPMAHIRIIGDSEIYVIPLSKFMIHARERMLAIIPVVLLISSSLVVASPFSDHDLDSITVETGTYHAVDLGEISAGNQVDISFFASEELDGLLMTESHYDSWTSGGTEFIRDGSSIGQSMEIYTYTIESDNHYWYVFDNSEQNPGGTAAGPDSTITTGGINVHEPLVDGINTRAMISPGSILSYDLGVVQEGNLLDLSITCENLFSDDVDIFVVSGSDKSDFEAGESSWNQHASMLGSCFELWNFEVETTDSWTVYIENGPRGEASEGSDSIQVDLNFWTRSLFPGEITSNTRMIDSGEVWRVDLGAISSGDTMSFTLGLEGVFDELDVLIMDHNQANLFLSGESATVLGHPSLIKVDFFDSWDYRFPKAGSYSLILDNSAEPQGGSDMGSDIHVQFSVQDTTILSDWIGWYQSRHYVEEGAFVSFDLGELEADDEFSYTVGGHSHGTGFMNAFDVLVFDDAEYQIYNSGGDALPIGDYSTLDEWLLAYNNFSISEDGHYWIVIDAADGPSTVDSADANGAWTFDYTITSSGSISSPQAEDGNYEMTATNLGTNAPDDGTGTGTDDGTGTGTDDGTGTGTDDGPEIVDEDLSDIGEQKPEQEVPGAGFIFAILSMTLAIFYTRRE